MPARRRSSRHSSLQPTFWKPDGAARPRLKTDSRTRRPMDKLEIKAAVSIDDAGTVTGIAWPFGSPDSVGDVIEPGAFSFAKSLPMVMEHDQKQVVGVWETFAETDNGLEVKGRLFVEGIGPARDAHRQL